MSTLLASKNWKEFQEFSGKKVYVTKSLYKNEFPSKALHFYDTVFITCYNVWI